MLIVALIKVCNAPIDPIIPLVVDVVYVFPGH